MGTHLVVSQFRVADQDNRENAPTRLNDFHESLQSGERVAVEVMNLVAKKYNRFLALPEQLLQETLPLLGLRGHFRFQIVRDIEKERGHQGEEWPGFWKTGPKIL